MTHRSIARAAARGAPLFVGSHHCRTRGFARNHPLAIPRVATVIDLCDALGWLDEDSFRRAPTASMSQLTAFHDPAYVEALRDADAKGVVAPEARARHNFGTFENPLFPGVFERAATAVGGSILAAELALDGRAVFHPAGGTHHGRRDRAGGFCYFNDPVFAIATLLDRGLERVLYVDLDAHHCDGVQDAFDGDGRVRVISIHEAGRWPHTGAADDCGSGNVLNLPVPARLNDSEFRWLFDGIVLPAARAFEPEGVVVTCGTDSLAGDPLSGMALSNGALWGAVMALVGFEVPAVVLGGGGYNPWTLARCWTGLWGRLTGAELPQPLPPAAQRILAELHCDLVDPEDVKSEWLTTLADPPNVGPVRDEVRDLAARLAGSVHELA